MITMTTSLMPVKDKEDDDDLPPSEGNPGDKHQDKEEENKGASL
jgi:hypothetical protein